MTFACPATDDFFRSRMPWQEIEARVAQVFSRKGRAGVVMPDLDLFGELVQRVAVASNAGRPRVPLRIMIALLYLKHVALRCLIATTDSSTAADSPRAHAPATEKPAPTQAGWAPAWVNGCVGRPRRALASRAWRVAALAPSCWLARARISMGFTANSV